MARAIVTLLLVEREGFDTFNIGSGHAYDAREIVYFFERAANRPLAVNVATDRLRQVDRAVLQADITKIKQITGWTPEVEIQEGIRALVQGDALLASSATSASMNLALLFKRPDKRRRVFQLARGRRCATVPEVERLIQSAAAQRSRPQIDCFLGKRNIFQSEAILEILKASGFSPAFSPGVGGALKEDEIFHLANFLDVLRFNYEGDEERKAFYRSWRDQLVVTEPRNHYSYLRNLSNLRASPTSKMSKLLSLFKRNDLSQPAGSQDSPTLMAFLQGRSTEAPFGPTLERLDVGGWQSTRMFLLPEESESALIERAFEAASQAWATPISPPRILICGWYGTETLGDKAILGGIVEVARRRWPSVSGGFGLARAIRVAHDRAPDARAGNRSRLDSW